MGGMEWRPVNRYSGNAKQHRGHRERPEKTTEKTTEKDLDTSVSEIFSKWKEGQDK